jgi:hypothetical protein
VTLHHVAAVDSRFCLYRFEAVRYHGNHRDSIGAVRWSGSLVFYLVFMGWIRPKIPDIAEIVGMIRN